MRLRVALLAVMLLAVSCRSERVDLSYRYDQRERLEYELEARAEATWEIGQAGSGSYDVRLKVVEEIEPQPDGTALVNVTMTPIDVNENGLLPPGSDERSFRLQLGENGEKLQVLEVDGVPATDLDDDELALIGTYRPPLPLDPVALRDSWDARQRLTLEDLFQQIVVTGTLEGLHRAAGGNRIAELRYEGDGPVEQSLSLPQGEAALRGETSVEIEAELDLDRGVLVEASSTTTGSFEARVTPGGEEAPTVGGLDLQLELKISEV